ncbi:hypothetical protein [Nitrososphaeria virus YSH_462411]|uniref:Uncharacterized protein n=1 Tax=Nitrososphaeria virus YSH_462411 TaxID=3071321 RepID=A0A976UAJ7_9CAUD|nr:hypothetical protein QKV92_gp69 [Yangshan Harbor Nitrososphaeria virus]UVF62341.1 hypothetical protein [Nitrososphaeria virus YSH_462411]
MSEVDYGIILAQILVPTLGSVIAVWKIGNRIKEALCLQLNNLTIEYRTHAGISQDKIREFDVLKELLTNVIIKNGLKT